MKKILLTAAALTLGTSAYAWTTAQEDIHNSAVKVAGVDKTGIDWDGDKVATASTGTTKSATIKTASMGSYETAMATLASWSESAARAMTTAELAAADDAVETALAHWNDPMVQTASAKSDLSDVELVLADFKSKEDVGGVQMASVDQTGKTYTGMGGPLEEAQSYRPCDPGPGDDRCIQLYEPGVRESLAAWKGADSNVGMGGPYEPVAETSKPAATADIGMSGKTATEPSATVATGTGSDHSAHDMSTTDTTTSGKTTATATATPGVGGPIEQRTGYPACSATVTDSCIQLYERGVTGQGN